MANRLFSDPVLNYLTQYTVKRMPKTAAKEDNKENDQEGGTAYGGKTLTSRPSRGMQSALSSMVEGYRSEVRRSEPDKVPSPEDYFRQHWRQAEWFNLSNEEDALNNFLKKLTYRVMPDEDTSFKQKLKTFTSTAPAWGGSENYQSMMDSLVRETGKAAQRVGAGAGSERGFFDKLWETGSNWLSPVGPAYNLYENIREGQGYGGAVSEMFSWGDPDVNKLQRSHKNLIDYSSALKQSNIPEAKKTGETIDNALRLQDQEEEEEESDPERTPYGETVQEAKNRLRETSSLSPDAKGYGHAKGTTPTTMAFGYGGTAYGGQRRPDMSSNKTMDKLMRAVPEDVRSNLWTQANREADGRARARSLYQQKARDWVKNQYYGENKGKEQWNEKWKKLQEKQTGLSEAMAKLQRQRPDEGAWSAQSSKTLQRLRERNQELQESMSKAKAGKWLHEQDFNPENIDVPEKDLPEPVGTVGGKKWYPGGIGTLDKREGSQGKKKQASEDKNLNKQGKSRLSEFADKQKEKYTEMKEDVDNYDMESAEETTNRQPQDTTSNDFTYSGGVLGIAGSGAPRTAMSPYGLYGVNKDLTKTPSQRSDWNRWPDWVSKDDLAKTFGNKARSWRNWLGNSWNGWMSDAVEALNTGDNKPERTSSSVSPHNQRNDVRRKNKQSQKDKQDVRDSQQPETVTITRPATNVYEQRRANKASGVTRNKRLTESQARQRHRDGRMLPWKQELYQNWKNEYGGNMNKGSFRDKLREFQKREGGGEQHGFSQYATTPGERASEFNKWYKSQNEKSTA